MLMGSGWGLSLILLFRVVFVPMACGRDTNQKKYWGTSCFRYALQCTIVIGCSLLPINISPLSFSNPS